MGRVYYIFAMSILASSENKATTKQSRVALCFKYRWPENQTKRRLIKKTLLGPEHIFTYSISAEGVQQAGFGKLRLL